MIEEDDVMIHSIFEVYDQTKDKNDFIENIKVLHTVKERSNYLMDCPLTPLINRLYNRYYQK
mgnify:CR=1 FL=1